MTSTIKKHIGVTIILLASLSLFTYQVIGYKYYYNAIKSLNNVPIDSRKSQEIFFYGDSDYKVYSGTLAFILNFKSNHIIWFWGKNGLTYYVVDNKATFSSYRICDGDITKTGQGTVNKNVSLTYKDWLKGVKQGDIVGVELNVSSKKIQEVFSYNWWGFKIYTPDELLKICKNR